MSVAFLTQQGGILGPFAWVFGQILNLIYEFFGLFFNTPSLAICIVIFTIVAKMLMLPLTIKQQRSMKVSSKMNPELTKIQAKYKGKKDQASQQKQQQEMQAVYEKYGSSPLSGCLPLLISLPIMFALYRVIYKMPAYIDDVYGLYNVVAGAINELDGIYTAIAEFIAKAGVSVSAPEFAINISDNIPKLIDVLSGFTPEHWDMFSGVKEGVATAVTTFEGANTWNTLAPTIQTALSTTDVTTAIDQIHTTNNLMFGLSIVNMSGWSFPGIVIPILAAAFQFLQTKLAQFGQPKPTVDKDNPAAQSSKAMTTIMPVISFFFCTMMPLGVGLYWIIGSVVQIVQQFMINRYFDKIGVDEIIEQNAVKASKKKGKYGVSTGGKMSEVAKIQARTIESKKTETPVATTSIKDEGSAPSDDTDQRPKSLSDVAKMFGKKNG